MADKTKILIVEDDIDLVEMLSAYFRVQNYEIVTAGWGEDGVQMAGEEDPDLILLDIRLPDIDGYEVCRRLRQQRITRYVPIIFLTEKREREDKLSGLELGAVDYITKPFDIQELRLRVRNALRRAKLSTLVNPVTGLPEGKLVQERLEQMLELPDWELVLASIGGLNRFRDRYGFVAADDVARAVSLMITNALAESGASESFVGHLDVAEFAIIVEPEEQVTLRQAQGRRVVESCRERLEPAIPYFYPASDREQTMQLPESERLSVYVTGISSEEGTFDSLESLQLALTQVVH